MLLFHKNQSKVSSRQQIQIKQVNDGILELTKGKYRLILHVSPINFELKSEAEQDALIDIYQSVLNSLSHPIQILTSIREMDLDRYIEDLKAKQHNETIQVYKKQINNYAEFVKKLVSKNKVLSRKFYIVIPIDDSSSLDFETIREQLLLSADILSKGLGRLGMHVKRLTSLEVLEYFYDFYNPKSSKRQPFIDKTISMFSESLT